MYLGRFARTGTECSKEEREQRLPNTLLIGERKTGTFNIVQFLVAINSQIITSMTGETHFFDVNGKYARGLKWYRKNMAPSCPGDIIIVKTPSYLRTSIVPQRVHDWNKDVKLIVSLRDPVARAISDFYFEQRVIHNYIGETFTQLALDKHGQVDPSFPPVTRSLYYMNFVQWLRYFPLEQFHVVDADAFAHNPSEELMKIELFLGLEPACTPDRFYQSEAGFYKIKIVGRKFVQGEKGHAHPPVPEHVINKLHAFYRPSVIKLQKLLCRKLSWMDTYLN